MNIVITGASKGIGRAVAEAFAAEGNTLFLCARNEADLTHAVNTIMTTYPGSQVYGVVADLSLREGITTLVDRIHTIVEKIDILVNNAGRFIPGTIAGEPEGTLDDMIRTNLYSAYHLTRALLPAMIQAKNGHIFNICSIAALNAYPNGGSYSISKFAMLGFSKNLREEMKPHQVKVTAVHPGAVYTASWEFSDVKPERIMAAADIATMIVAASKLSPQAVVEEIILRPQLGDL